jgi:hypothetical protein
MNVLYYYETESRLARDLRAMIEAEPSLKYLELFGDIQLFSRHLSGRLDVKTVAVVLTEKEDELLSLYFIKHLLSKTPLFLILPDGDPVTRAIGFRINPTAWCHKDSPADLMRLALRQAMRDDRMDRSRANAIERFGGPGDRCRPLATDRAA